MYEYTEHGDAVIIKITGTLDIQNADNLKDWILNYFLSEGKRFIILDLTHATNIDSYGLGVLVSIYKRTILQNGYLKVIAPNRNVCALFEITGLDRIIKIYNTVSEALSE